MSRILRAALTQTVNAYREMPSRREDLHLLKDRLDDVRRANVEHHLYLMKAAAAQGVKAIGFGELFPGPYFALESKDLWFGLAEDALAGPTVAALKEGARAHGMVVVAPIYEQAPTARRFNTAVVIDADGEVIGKYRKTHIPFGRNEEGEFVENYYYDRSDGDNVVPGKEAFNVSENPYFPVFRTAYGRIGVSICYDRHFNGVIRSLAIGGAELVFSPAVTFGSKSRRMWQHEFPTDACRHGLFIGGSNRKGSEAPWNQPYFGESYFVGPNGPLENVSTHENLVIADVDLDELTRPDPAGWNVPRDVRHDTYSFYDPDGRPHRKP